MKIIFFYMTMLRGTKWAIIGGVYIVLFSLFVFWIYSAFFKSDPTCFDAVLNQDETAVDCGGVCGACQEKPITQDIQIQEVKAIYGGAGRTDVLAKIYNPNDREGASSFTYAVSLKDASGSIVTQRSGKGFLLPKETKYLIETNFDTEVSGIVAEIKLENVQWQVFSGYREKPVLNVYSKRYGPVTSGVGFGQVDGTISNDSGFDFQSIIVKVVLRDGSGMPVAMNSTEMRTVNAGERRDFHLIWPTNFPGDVERIEVETDVDVYSVDNFIRTYLPGGDFQRF